MKADRLRQSRGTGLSRAAGWFCGACALLALVAAVLPYGAVAPDARLVVLSLALVAATWGMGSRGGLALHPLMVLCLIGIAGTTLLRQVPLPLPVAVSVAPGMAGLLPLLDAAGERVTLAYAPFLERSKLALYLAYALLGGSAAVAVRGSRRRRGAFIRLLLAAGTVQAMAGIFGVSSLGWYVDSRFGGVRAVGTFSGPNAFGGFVAMLLVATAGYALAIGPSEALRWQRHWRALLHTRDRQAYRLIELPAVIGCLVVQSTALLLSASRGATGATAGALGILLAWRTLAVRGERGPMRSLAGVASLVVAGMIALGIGGAFAVYRGRLVEAFTDPSQTAVARTDIWMRTVTLIREHPLGVGFGGFGTAYTRYARLTATTRVYHAHNDYLEFLAEGGIFAALVAVFLIGWLVYTVARPAVSEDDAIWLKRGLGLAAGCGLLHAIVDFNISSRPGVGVLFCLLVGAMAGLASRHAARPRAGIMRPGLVLLAALLLLPDVWRHAETYRDIERGFTAAGGASELYRWWPVGAVPSESAPTATKRAIARAPRHGWAHVMHARVLMLDIANRQRALEREIHRQDDSMPHAPVRALAVAALAGDRAIAAQAAIDACDAAIRLTPLDPLAYAYKAEALGLLAPLLPDVEAQRHVLDVLERTALHATLLAPNDTTVLLPVLRALAQAVTVLPDGDTRRVALAWSVRETGIRLLQLRIAMLADVADAFRTVGLELDAVLPDDGIPLLALWHLASRLGSQGENAAAVALLDRIERHLDDPDAALSGEDGRGETALARARLAALVTRQRVRMLLLERPYLGLGDAHPAVFEAARRHVDYQLGIPRAGTSRLARLGELQRVYGLPPALRDDWLRGLAASGDFRTVDSVLQRELLRSILEDEPAQALTVNSLLDDLPPDAVARPLVQAWEALQDARFEAAVEALDAALSARGLAAGARPLVAVMLADALHASGRVAARDSALRRAIAGAPDLRPAWERVVAWRANVTTRDVEPGLDGLIPLPFAFGGGTVTLEGVTLEPYSITVAFTCWDRVPSDLTVRILVYDSGGMRIGGRSMPLTRLKREAFAGGSPAWGDRYRVSVPLRTYGLPVDQLSVEFLSRTRHEPFATVYGDRRLVVGSLSRLEIGPSLRYE